MRHRDGSVILPDQYIALAAAAGHIGTIDNLLLFRRVQLIRRIHRDHPAIGFFCNISRDSLADAEFFPQFVDFLEHNVELAGVLVFEFPQAALSDPAVEANLAPLARLGFTFSIDHVRSLALDLTRLAQRGIRFIKIPAAMLLSERHQANAAFHIDDLKPAAKRLGIDLVAEKVEVEPSVVGLIDLGIELAQGYLFGEPRPSRIDP